MNRNFCVISHLYKISKKEDFFICRNHKQMPYKALGESKKIGAVDTGEAFEQWVEVHYEENKNVIWRCITIKLKNETRDGDSEIKIITNLPKSAASALIVAGLYRKRWSIETLFQQLESDLHSEIHTLGYPKAARFVFCVALIAYNVLAVVKAAMRSVHGEEKVNTEVSGYYIAGEIERTREGMEIAINAEEWHIFLKMEHEEFVSQLLKFAANIKLKKYKKHSRGPKKKTKNKIFLKNEPRISTYKLLKKIKKSPWKGWGLVQNNLTFLPVHR